MSAKTTLFCIVLAFTTSHKIKRMGLTRFLICFFFSTTAFSQNVILDWCKSVGANFNEEGNVIAMDAQNNVYVAGKYQSGTIVDVDPGSGVSEISGNGGTDFFLLKLDEQGNFLWAKSFGGAGDENVFDLEIGSSGELYLTGVFQGTTDFDADAGVETVTALGWTDAYVLKLNADGEFIWVETFGGVDLVYSYGLAVDQNDNIYITGMFSGSIDFETLSGIPDLYSSYATWVDVFCLKMDSNGVIQWAKKMGGFGNDIGEAITIDSGNNILLTGRFQDTIDFDPGPSVALFTTDPWDNSNFVLKLDSDGNFIWAKTNNGINQISSGYAIKSDDVGNIYTTGYFSDTVDFDPGPGIYNLASAGSARDIFIQKLDASGNFLWVKKMGITGEDFGNMLEVDNTGNVYSIGTFIGPADFDPGSGVTNLTSTGWSTYIQKLDASGNFVWAKSFKTDISTSFGDGRQAIFLNDNGTILITGKYRNTVDFDPNAGTFSASSQGSHDLFIVKLLDCLPLESDFNETACNSYTWPLNGNTYTSSGSYTATIPAVSGCDSVVTLNLSITSVLNSVFQNGAVLTANQTGASYQWLDCENGNAPIVGATAQTYIATENGSYAVQITLNGCTVTSTCQTVSGLNIDNATPAQKIEIFPNPTFDFVTVQVSKDNPIDAIVIKTADGKIVQNVSVTSDNDVQVVLPSETGIYILEVFQGGEPRCYKVIKL
jgi:hypothetical protein